MPSCAHCNYGNCRSLPSWRMRQEDWIIKSKGVGCGRAGSPKDGKWAWREIICGPSQMYLKWYLLEMKQKREVQVRRGLGLHVGKHWVGYHGCWVGVLGRSPPCCLSWEEGMVRFKTPLEIPISHCHKCELSQGLLAFKGWERKTPPTDPETNHFLFDREGVYHWRLLNILGST